MALPAHRSLVGVSAADTVKGVFTEGTPLYEGSGFREKTHIQIVVRDSQCIKGLFGWLIVSGVANSAVFCRSDLNQIVNQGSG